MNNESGHPVGSIDELASRVEEFLSALTGREEEVSINRRPDRVILTPRQIEALLGRTAP